MESVIPPLSLPSTFKRVDSGGSTASSSSSSSSTSVSARSSSACSSLFSLPAGELDSNGERRESFASSVFEDDTQDSASSDDALLAKSSGDSPPLLASSFTSASSNSSAAGSATPSPRIPPPERISFSRSISSDTSATSASSESSSSSSSSSGASHDSIISTTNMATPTAELYALSLQPITATPTPTSTASPSLSRSHTNTSALSTSTSSSSNNSPANHAKLPPATSPDMIRFAQRVASRGVPLFSHTATSSAKAASPSPSLSSSSSPRPATSRGGRVLNAQGFPWTARPSSSYGASRSSASSSSLTSYSSTSPASSNRRPHTSGSSINALVATPSAIFSTLIDSEDEGEQETEMLSELFPSSLHGPSSSSFHARPATRDRPSERSTAFQPVSATTVSLADTNGTYNAQRHSFEASSSYRTDGLAGIASSGGSGAPLQDERRHLHSCDTVNTALRGDFNIAATYPTQAVFNGVSSNVTMYATSPPQHSSASTSDSGAEIESRSTSKAGVEEGVATSEGGQQFKLRNGSALQQIDTSSAPHSLTPRSRSTQGQGAEESGADTATTPEVVGGVASSLSSNSNRIYTPALQDMSGTMPVSEILGQARDIARGSEVTHQDSSRDAVAISSSSFSTSASSSSPPLRTVKQRSRSSSKAKENEQKGDSSLFRYGPPMAVATASASASAMMVPSSDIHTYRPPNLPPLKDSPSPSAGLATGNKVILPLSRNDALSSPAPSKMGASASSDARNAFPTESSIDNIATTSIGVPGITALPASTAARMGLSTTALERTSKPIEYPVISNGDSVPVPETAYAHLENGQSNMMFDRKSSMDYGDHRHPGGSGYGKRSSSSSSLYGGSMHLNSLNYHAGNTNNTYATAGNANSMMGTSLGNRPSTSSSMTGGHGVSSRPWIRDSDSSSVRSSSGFSSEGSSFDGSEREPSIMSPAAPPPVPFLSTAPAPRGCKVTVEALQPDGFDIHVTLPGFSFENITLALKRNGALHILADKYEEEDSGHFERMVELGDAAINCKVTAEFDGHRLLVHVRKSSKEEKASKKGSYTSSSYSSSSTSHSSSRSRYSDYHTTAGSASSRSTGSGATTSASSDFNPGSYSPPVYEGGTDPVAFYSSSPTMFGTSIIGKSPSAYPRSTQNADEPQSNPHNGTTRNGVGTRPRSWANIAE